MGRRYSHIPKYSVAKLIDAPVDENTHSKKNSKKTLKNSSKKLKKSAFFETLFAGNASKKEACIRKSDILLTFRKQQSETYFLFLKKPYSAP